MKVRSIFISDVHLGTRGCQADRLLDFLRDYESENLFLVGDIIDFWSMNRSIHWTPAQNTVVQKILRRARHGDNGMLADLGASDQFVRGALDLVTRPQARRRAAAAAPCSVAALDWEHIHEQLVAALRDAIARPALPPEGEAVYRFLADQ